MARALLDGLRAWTLQRASALYLLVFGIVLTLRMLAAPPASHAAWVALWGEPAMAAGALLAFASVCLHAWVGARDVILDYVRPAGARPIALGLVAAVLLFTGFRLGRALLAIGPWGAARPGSSQERSCRCVSRSIATTPIATSGRACRTTRSSFGPRTTWSWTR